MPSNWEIVFGIKRHSFGVILFWSLSEIFIEGLAYSEFTCMIKTLEIQLTNKNQSFPPKIYSLQFKKQGSVKLGNLLVRQSNLYKSGI